MRNELNSCDKLLGLANISGVCKSVARLCRALFILSDESGPNPNDCKLTAFQLQKAMDEYVSILENKICSSAPSYPFEWLQKRNMTNIRHFQAPEDVKDVNLLLFNQLIKSGIEAWKNDARRVTLSTISEAVV